MDMVEACNLYIWKFTLLVKFRVECCLLMEVIIQHITRLSYRKEIVKVTRCFLQTIHDVEDGREEIEAFILLQTNCPDDKECDSSYIPQHEKTIHEYLLKMYPYAEFRDC